MNIEVSKIDKLNRKLKLAAYDCADFEKWIHDSEDLSDAFNAMRLNILPAIEYLRQLSEKHENPPPIDVLATQQCLRDLADARKLLSKCLQAFNKMPNHKLTGIPNIKNSYDLCVAVKKFLIMEESDKLHVWLSNKAAKFYTYETIVDTAYRKFDRDTISHFIINYGHGFKELREVYIDLLGRNE